MWNYLWFAHVVHWKASSRINLCGINIILVCTDHFWTISIATFYTTRFYFSLHFIFISEQLRIYFWVFWENLCIIIRLYNMTLTIWKIRIWIRRTISLNFPDIDSKFPDVKWFYKYLFLTLLILVPIYIVQNQTCNRLPNYILIWSFSEKTGGITFTVHLGFNQSEIFGCEKWKLL